MGLFMLGDQVYADEPSEPTREWLAARRDTTKPPFKQVANFEEYTHLYQEAWSDPDVRWLLSVVPSSMIFDDHDVLDDWNTSRAWRDEMQATSWWEERITGALSSYWIYQHLGNLSPAGLAADETYREVRAASDGEAVLRAFAQAADKEADGARGALWSYRRDLGGVRVIIIDSRAGRILGGETRLMVGEREFAWIEEQVADGEYDHLVIGTSVPWLLPRALHDVESANEAPVRRQPRPARRPPLGEGPARRGPRALGGVRRLVRAARQAHRPGRVRRGRPTGAGNHLRALGRRPPHVRQRGGLPAAHAITRLPAHLLAHAQRHPARDAARVQGRVEPVRVAPDPVPRPVRAGDARVHRLDDDGGAVLRQQRRVAALRRPDRGLRAREVRSRGRARPGQARDRRVAGPHERPAAADPRPRRRPDDSGRSSSAASARAARSRSTWRRRAGRCATPDGRSTTGS